MTTALKAPCVAILEAVEQALDLHLRFPHLQARDSLHAAVMLQHGVIHIISADQHFDGLPGLSRVDPSTFHGDK